MTGGHGSTGIIMRRPDGTPMSRNEVIVRRRGAFLWLPPFCANDLVHGSWWFTFGSALTAASGIYPLVQKYVMDEQTEDDLLPSTDYDITWASIIISGLFFTAGSLAFVRAFEEPPRQALFQAYKHFQTDELLGAWLFLLGTAPSIPYILVFFLIDPSAFYFFCFLGAIVLTMGTGLFVVACYPSDKKRENYILPIFLRINGAQMWAVKHLANDWLAGTWFFLWANALLTLGSFIMLLIALGLNNSGQVFIWLSGTLASLIFLIGSLYFVSGSYPHAQQFYYVTGRARSDSEDQYDDLGLLNAESPTAATSGKVVRVVYPQPLPPPVIRKMLDKSRNMQRDVEAGGDEKGLSVHGQGQGKGPPPPVPLLVGADYEEAEEEPETAALITTEAPSASAAADSERLAAMPSPVRTVNREDDDEDIETPSVDLIAHSTHAMHKHSLSAASVASAAAPSARGYFPVVEEEDEDESAQEVGGTITGTGTGYVVVEGEEEEEHGVLGLQHIEHEDEEQDEDELL